MEYYIYSTPLFMVDETPPEINIPRFCQEVEEILPPALLDNVEVVYVGNFKELKGRNAAFSHGGIYMTATEPTSFDMVENFVHEVAHSLEGRYTREIYTDDFRNEFLGKRRRLRDLLEAQGYHITPALYEFTEYNEKFDKFLAEEVGYPLLLNLTMGLFVSPYGATSLQEYFANGFEKYFLDNAIHLRNISPILYEKIEEIINEQA